MIDKKIRYFVWRFYYPVQEIKTLIGANTHPIFNDEQYSLLKDKLGSICINILHIFEQPEFSSIHGITKRNELNQLNSRFHRVLSYGIKYKHGEVTNPHYSNFQLNTPICAYIFAENGKYDYFYHPNLVGEDGIQHSLLDDLEYCLLQIIDMFGLSIKSMNKMFEIKEKYEYKDDKLRIQLIDNYSIYSTGFMEGSSINIFKFIGNDWVPTDHAFEFKLVPSTTIV